MKKTIVLFWILALSVFSVCQAQNRTITGLVIEKDTDLGIPGVSVIALGTSGGTVTNMDGEFNLIVEQNVESIQVSFIGMQTQIVKLDQRDHYNVILDNESIGLDEVIAVAYGTTKKSSFTGAATSIKGEKLATMQSADLSKSLEGTIAGVQVTQSSGQPGSGASIVVRGVGSMSTSSAPLIVLDGVPYEGSLNSIPAQDIESFSVQKDAVATSLYGARGANGIIIITTKRGKEGTVKINFDSRIGINMRGVSNYDIVTNPTEYYELAWESQRNTLLSTYGYERAGREASKMLIDQNLKYNVYHDVHNQEVVDPYTGKINPNAKATKWGNEWTTEPFQNGQRQEYNLSFSGGSKQSSYYASFGYLSDEGIIQGSDFERLSTRFQIDQKFTKWLKLSGSVAYIGTMQNSATGSGGSQSNLFMFTQSIAPIYPVYQYNIDTGVQKFDTNGQPLYDYGLETSRPFGTLSNPMATNTANINDNKSDNVNFRGAADFYIAEGLSFTVNGAYDLYFNNISTFMSPVGGDAASIGGLGYKTSSRYSSINFNQLMNYSKSIGGHNFKALLGHEIKQNKSNQMNGSMANFFDPNNPEFANASLYQSLTSSLQEYALEGYFSQLNYNWVDKYYLSGSIRRDGSSVFHPDSRWGNFWSVGGSWRMSEETFIKNLDFVNNLKLRVSYGTQGKDAIGTWYAYQDQYSVVDTGGEAAIVFGSRGNPDLTWETGTNFTAGLDSRLFNSLDISFDFFIQDTNDQLFKYYLPMSQGLPQFQWRNDMASRNTGFELDLNMQLINKDALRWSVSANATHYKNEITRLPSQKDPTGYAETNYWRSMGGTMFDFYDIESAGVDPLTGKALFYKYEFDHYGNRIVSTVEDATQATLVKTGKNSIPDVVGGLGSVVNYKGFDLSVQMAYQIGGTLLDSNYSSLMGSTVGGNYHRDMLKRWTPLNTNSDVPILTYNDMNMNAYSDRFYTSASYFSIRNVTLGYNLPKQLIERLSIDNCQIYATGDNLWLKSARQGLDPRQSLSGAVGFNYSAMRTISLGLKLNL
ncbi:SusC/RagA family TonB-linked outer membrane protein [Saccharicrinis aurantiacus]|uniref:SusC/RagA family TonB-linked outer membrane protein n=1 Tax=Saccharicrinis aurantiacus TaxID=1849719 RepID=UPI00094FFD2E|nr:TonB-dependent receptor [Saccharicrinis aurantiacus]